MLEDTPQSSFPELSPLPDFDDAILNSDSYAHISTKDGGDRNSNKPKDEEEKEESLAFNEMLQEANMSQSMQRLGTSTNREVTGLHSQQQAHSEEEIEFNKANAVRNREEDFWVGLEDITEWPTPSPFE